MTVRFSTWVEADNLEEAREKLRLSLEDKRMGDKLRSEFTVTILEDGAEDKANIKGELTVRELFEWCLNHGNCEGCKPQETGYECLMSPGMDIEVITQIVRGNKPEGEER